MTLTSSLPAIVVHSRDAPNDPPMRIPVHPCRRRRPCGVRLQLCGGTADFPQTEGTCPSFAAGQERAAGSVGSAIQALPGRWRSLKVPADRIGAKHADGYWSLTPTARNPALRPAIQQSARGYPLPPLTGIATAETMRLHDAWKLRMVLLLFGPLWKAARPGTGVRWRYSCRSGNRRGAGETSHRQILPHGRPATPSSSQSN